MGALLADISHRRLLEVRKKRWRALWTFVIVAGLVGLCATWSIRPLHLSFINLILTAILGLLLCSLDIPQVALLRDRRLVYLGVISYGFYLYHPLVFAAVDSLGHHWLLDIIKIPLVACVAGLSWTWIERPLLRFKKRFEYHGTVPPPREMAPDTKEASIPIGI